MTIKQSGTYVTGTMECACGEEVELEGFYDAGYARCPECGAVLFLDGE